MFQLNMYYKTINIQMMRLTILSQYPVSFLQLHSHDGLASIIKTASSIHTHPAQTHTCSQYENFMPKVSKHLTDNTHRANRLDQFFTVPPEHKMKNKIARHIPGKLSINIINNRMITKENILVMNSLPVYTRWNTGEK